MWSLLQTPRRFLDRHFLLFLIFTVLISYGQMLGMYVWQDDNALFFKLAHIEEPAGYFGTGVVGNGLTKWAAAPFYPVYLLFGHNEFFYFAFLLLLYLLATLAVYKAFSTILGKTGGRVAGFIFAAGYVASDGIWRMANSATTSLSIILTSLFLLSYWKFYKRSRVLWYLAALLFFFLSAEIAVGRTHYLFTIVVLFELIFLTFKRPVKSIVLSLIRLAPFFYIFNNWAVGASASRTPQLREFALAFLQGDFHLYYGFFSSITNLVVPDWFTNYLFVVQRFGDALFHTHIPLLRLILLLLPVLVSFLFLKRHPKRKILFPTVFLVSLMWTASSKEIFTTTFVQPTLEQYFLAALGGTILLIAAVAFIVLGKARWLFLFLSFWGLINLTVYSAYNPTYQYGTVERYIAHSFLPFVGLLGLFFILLPKQKILGKVGMAVILLLGVGNLVNSVLYQNTILQTRSLPAKDFYKQLKVLLPTIEKGDILYFDVSQESQRYYNDAIATAMMPETTAFAWRYGIDRYDIKLITEFPNLLEIVEGDGVAAENLHAFWYSNHSLLDKTEKVRGFFWGQPSSKLSMGGLQEKSEAKLSIFEKQTFWAQPDLEINLREPLDSTVPTELTLELSAVPVTGSIVYPLLRQNSSLSSAYREFSNDPSLRRLALEYKKAKQETLTNSQYKVTSEWQNNVVKNLHDADINSVWQSERTGWGREFTFIEVQLPYLQEVDKAMWINGFSHNTPIGYDIEVSLDGEIWKTVTRVQKLQRIDNREPQVVAFAPTKARFIRMVLRETLNGDSPVVAEFWPVLARFSKLDINLAEKFLEDPLAFVPDKTAFQEDLAGLGNKGRMQLVWDSNKKSGWESTKQSEFEVFYDGIRRRYKVTIPAGGTEISRLKISNIAVPGAIFLHSVTSRYPRPEELITTN